MIHGARTRSVKCNTDDPGIRFDLAVRGGLGDDGGDMGVVMLDLYEGQPRCPCLLARPLAGQIAGVRVAGECGRAQVEEPFHTRARRLPGVKGLGVFEVADVLRNKALSSAGAVFACEGEGRFLLGAAGEDAERTVVVRLVCGRARGCTCGRACCQVC